MRTINVRESTLNSLNCTRMLIFDCPTYLLVNATRCAIVGDQARSNEFCRAHHKINTPEILHLSKLSWTRHVVHHGVFSKVTYLGSKSSNILSIWNVIRLGIIMSRNIRLGYQHLRPLHPSKQRRYIWSPNNHSSRLLTCPIALHGHMVILSYSIYKSWKYSTAT